MSNIAVKYDPLVRMTVKRASKVFAATRATANLLPEAVIIPAIGYPSDSLSSRTTSRHNSTIELLYVGNLLYLKGLQLALPAIARAVKEGIEVKFTIVGEGPFRATLERQAENLSISNFIEFKGKMSLAEVLQIYQQHDALLFPSLRDSGGFVVLEAMAASLPVICLDLGGPSESVTDQTGIRVPAHNPRQVVADLSSAILRLSTNPDLRNEMGANGQARVREEYSWQRKGAQVRELYMDVVKGAQ
jgi:glycosyltransferase involved in cell wall biosynthesis